MIKREMGEGERGGGREMEREREGGRERGKEAETERERRAAVFW